MFNGGLTATYIVWSTFFHIKNTNLGVDPSGRSDGCNERIDGAELL